MQTKQELITENMNMVYSVIHKEYPTYINDEDVIQSGMLGLCNAADKWDESKSKFSTYAWTSIRNAINNELIGRAKHQGVLSLDYMVGANDGEKAPLGELIPAENDGSYVEAEFDERCLTELELKVHKLFRKGYTRKEIAKLLGKSQPTIQAIVRQIKRKRG